MSKNVPTTITSQDFLVLLAKWALTVVGAVVVSSGFGLMLILAGSELQKVVHPDYLALVQATAMLMVLWFAGAWVYTELTNTLRPHRLSKVSWCGLAFCSAPDIGSTWISPYELCHTMRWGFWLFEIKQRSEEHRPVPAGYALLARSDRAVRADDLLLDHAGQWKPVTTVFEGCQISAFTLVACRSAVADSAAEREAGDPRLPEPTDARFSRLDRETQAFQQAYPDVNAWPPENSADTAGARER